MANCILRGHQRYANEIKLTWEVCQEAGVSSYKMHHNPKYAVIDELRREKLLLHSPMKDGADTVENSSSNYVYRGQEEQQNQDNVAKSYSVEQAGNVTLNISTPQYISHGRNIISHGASWVRRVRIPGRCSGKLHIRGAERVCRNGISPAHRRS